MTEPGAFVARYPNICDNCGDPITQDIDRIIVANDRPIHEKCAAAEREGGSKLRKRSA